MVAFNTHSTVICSRYHVSQTEPINYLQPDVPDELPWVDVPRMEATQSSLEGYGFLVEDYHDYPLEIVQWPAQGWRGVDAGTGDEAGTVQGVFHSAWKGSTLFGRNDAVEGHYVLAWDRNPGDIAKDSDHLSSDHRPQRLLMWHANYHPDGGQLFFPLDGQPFVVPLALPGDDIRPDKFVAFTFDGSKGLYIHPNTWHEGVFPIAGEGRFYDEQGRVHARVSVNFATEFGVFLNVPLD